MRTVEFRRLFDDQNAARVRFETERNRVLGFMVQLECLFGEEWHPVVRYDSAHGFAHRDILRPSGETEKSATSVRDYNESGLDVCDSGSGCKLGDLSAEV